jgi:general secretion pathway protein G
MRLLPLARGAVVVCVVLTVTWALATLVKPRPFGCGSREPVLRTDLRVFREVLAEYHRDHREYPVNLVTLVTARYLRRIPVDPITKSTATWVPVFGFGGGIVDVRSGALERGSDGRRYSQW